jgi:adenosine deaminase
MHTAKDRYPTAEMHVFGEFHAAKLPLCICTDDTGVFANCLSSEYSQIAAAFQLSRAQMFDIAEQAVHLTFDEQVRPGLLEQFRQVQCTLLN